MIRHLLLDLDNTLYPSSDAMDEGITKRMLAFVADYLKLDHAEAVRLRAERLPMYGTTLEWLTREHGLADPVPYFAAVHPEEEIDELTPDPCLRPYLQSLGLPMTLLTNAPMAHAARVLRFFGIEDLFLGVFDLTWHGGRGKPHPDCFLSTLAAVGKTVDETLFVDDHPKYARGYLAVGGKPVLVDERDRHPEVEAEGIPRIRSIYELKAFLDNS